MPLTTDQKHDLTVRLEMLVGELAPASDRAAGVQKLHAILERIAVADEAPPAAAPASSGAPVAPVSPDGEPTSPVPPATDQTT